jgi:hypothetical protein
MSGSTPALGGVIDNNVELERDRSTSLMYLLNVRGTLAQLARAVRHCRTALADAGDSTHLSPVPSCK